MITVDTDRTERLAEALRQSGIASDVSETDPSPYWAAQQAFYVCEGHERPNDWREWRQSLTGVSVPPAAYYRGSMDVCRRALRRPDIADDLREAVAYAWGYFAGLLKAGREEAGDEGASGE